MIVSLAQMAVLILFGVLWGLVKPAGLTAEQTRLVLTNLVYFIMLPALVLLVLWQTEIGTQSLKLSLLASASVVFGGAVVWLVCLLFKFSAPQTGALILVTAFPNVTFLGLPLLEQIFGERGRSIAIQMDLFACQPILLTAGVMVAQYFGYQGSKHRWLVVELLKVPALWAAAAALLLNLCRVPPPEWLTGFLRLLVPGIVPLMLISLGLGLQWRSLTWRNGPKVLPVIVIQLMLMPFFAWWLAGEIKLVGDTGIAAILEIAMPSMLIGVVFCDRFRLDTSLYAMAVTVTTVLSMITLPLWFDWLKVHV